MVPTRAPWEGRRSRDKRRRKLAVEVVSGLNGRLGRRFAISALYFGYPEFKVIVPLFNAESLGLFVL